MNFKQMRFQFFLMLLLFMVFSCSNDEETIALFDGDCLVEINGEFIQAQLDQQPEFIQGGQDSFIIKLYKNMTYPATARELSVEGDARISFVITSLGIVTNIVVLEDPGAGIGESLRTGVELTTAGISFSAAIFNGNPVNVKKEIVAKYRLE